MTPRTHDTKIDETHPFLISSSCIEYEHRTLPTNQKACRGPKDSRKTVDNAETGCKNKTVPNNGDARAHEQQYDLIHALQREEELAKEKSWCVQVGGVGGKDRAEKGDKHTNVSRRSTCETIRSGKS